ncbi:uncharacterized protein LOC117533010 [Gymnodraco acuticeps]|uniref:Uncharacterized protein LOC117533010 n=1 Tax=Gymnodraco acuticeps TaxID=8218 RepID=A0A6P8T5T5_GYMAC|nr:uncharacterized protein LOC117533010 [Gymnodraco acuticeps]
MASSIPPPEPMKMAGDIHGNWVSFRAEFEDYLLATGLSEKVKPVQAAALRRLMGNDCRHVYKHNLGLTADQQKDAGAIVVALEQYFTPAKNVIFERYVFGNLKQEDGELLDAFATRLREKAASCEYGATKDELIRDRLVLGITDEGARRRLLREKDLKLDEAIQICRAAEVMDSKLKTMSLGSSGPGDSVNATQGQRYGRRSASRPSESTNTSAQPQSMRDAGECKYCGTRHKRGRDLCPAFGKSCRSCGTANHFAKVCMKRGQQARQLNAVDDPLPGELEDSDERDVYTAESVGAVNTRGKRWFVNLPLQSGIQRCQLDSGATCNVMSIKDKTRLAPRTPLLKSLTRLKLYNSEWMSSLGVYSTQCVIRGKTHRLDFEIVHTGQRPLLSGETCERLGLIRFTIPEELNKVEHCRKGDLTKGLKADPEKVRAVLDMPNPTDAKGVQRCVGFVNYLSRFMPHLSAVCEPLRRLLDKDVMWHWLPKHDAAMKEIKALVTAVPVLRYYDVRKPVTVQSDSSQAGLGCCLLQGGQPVAFASRALTQTEQNYSQIEKECLSIVFACQRFNYYLYGRGDVTAETDHRPLVSIFTKPLLSAPKRLQSMLLTLQN